MTSATYPDADIDYPESNGKPMAESDYQRPYIAYGTEVLNIFFADQAEHKAERLAARLRSLGIDPDLV